MSEFFPSGETMDKPELSIIRRTEGLGYGEGTISGVEASAEDLTVVDALIESPAILLPIDIDNERNAPVEDDGCGDGRGVGVVTKLGKELKRSLNRAKVFGGGLVMVAATRIGMGLANGKNYEENFTETITELQGAKIDFGAHTGPTHGEDESGCGALDKHPRALENTVIYQGQIWNSIGALGIDYDGVAEDFEDIIANNATMVEANRSRPFSGRRIMEKIQDAGKVVKYLVEGHNERRIVLNAVQGYTVNQQAVREATDGRVQIFATDFWRLKELADKVGTSAAERNKALLAQVIYTLGVAATLTKGDLPVYLIQEADVVTAA